MDLSFENSFHNVMEGFYAPAEALKPPSPELLIFNYALAERLGIATAGTDSRRSRPATGSSANARIRAQC